MEYYTYDGLFKVIQQQYPNSYSSSSTSRTKQESIMGSLMDAYQVPSSGNLIKAFKTATKPEEKMIIKDDVNSYVYVNKDLKNRLL